MSKHTPGPWYWTREKIGDEWHCFLRGKPNHLNDTLVTAMRTDLAAFPYAIDTPNAALIAAAPELLALAEQYASECAECNGTGGVMSPIGFAIDPCDACANIRAVIAKAKGVLS